MTVKSEQGLRSSLAAQTWTPKFHSSLQKEFLQYKIRQLAPQLGDPVPYAEGSQGRVPHGAFKKLYSAQCWSNFHLSSTVITGASRRERRVGPMAQEMGVTSNPGYGEGDLLRGRVRRSVTTVVMEAYGNASMTLKTKMHVHRDKNVKSWHGKLKLSLHIMQINLSGSRRTFPGYFPYGERGINWR
ncbi:hypothetical protein BDN71DRAFT_1430278 [Pleurotus eryngii]|uniref:Uncharacterized protein n=1 Tax=Pleurotus eryngii TaxID=5323 RepID=A0A9P5ZZ45_PLEER|nr:hypothetical protein BDN71DRAFT_1430278 [Pleurotus eryngii]